MTSTKEWPSVSKRWEVKPLPSPEEMADLLQIKGLNYQIAILLHQRGVRNEETLRQFFTAGLEGLHDPYLMKDMGAAVQKITEVMAAGGSIMIFGDYDVDGTTATALVFKSLSSHYAKVECYIPDRYTEGYGISIQGIHAAASKDISLIIALDCGVKAVDKVAYAKELGIEIVICDHHLPGPELPQAVAVLDPKRADCTYPFKELSGCGVGFKLMMALYDYCGWDKAELFAYLDLVAISIASDLVPIEGENRILVKEGLQKINRDPLPAVQALLEVAGIAVKEQGSPTVNVERLVFGIGPRINAAGRIAHGIGAVELLTSETLNEARERASMLNLHNNERKELDQNITREAIEAIQNSEKIRTGFSTVLFNPSWHKGIVGIVASRCIEYHYRPTIILTESNGVLTGSGRSILNFDLYRAIENCSRHLLQFGGHFHAAGLSLKPEELEAFADAFEAEARKQLNEEDLIPSLHIDSVIELSDLTTSFLTQLKRLEPFGPGNMNPLFLARNVRNKGFSRLLESKSNGKNHIKFSLTSAELEKINPDISIEGIGFNLGDYWPLVASNEPFNIVFHVEENHFRGKVSLQLNIKAVGTA